MSGCFKPEGRCAAKESDGKKPIMVLPAAAMAVGPSTSKCLRLSTDQDGTLEEIDFPSSESESDNDSDDSNVDLHSPSSSITLLEETWKTFSPPVTEDMIQGKWYGVIFSNKRSSQLFIGKVLRRFLTDENGPVDTLEIRCLKPKVGSGTIVDDTPSHLPDISLFRLADVIYGPLEVTPVRGGRFDVPSYQAVVAHFNSIKSMDREGLIYHLDVSLCQLYQLFVKKTV